MTCTIVGWKAERVTDETKKSASNVAPLRAPRPCPECGRPSHREHYPFCSDRCRNVDLNRWLSGSYAIPVADDEAKAKLDLSLQKAPANYRKLARLGSYGSFINQYLCGMNVRVTDLQGRTAYFPWITQNNGRCGEP